MLDTEKHLGLYCRIVSAEERVLNDRHLDAVVEIVNVFT